jgi:hypothetical protein
MINFKITILKYDKNTKSFLVEYTPDESMSPPCTTVTQHMTISTLNAETTQEEIFKTLSEISPQEFWKSQIDSADIPSEKFESLVGEEASYSTEDFIVPEGANEFVDLQIINEMQQQLKDIELEAAIQRVLGSLSKEQI